MIAADNEAGAKEVSIHDNTVGANSQVGAGQCNGNAWRKRCDGSIFQQLKRKWQA